MRPRTTFRIHVVEWGVDRSRRQDRGRCGCQDATTSGFTSESVHGMPSVRCARIHIRIASASIHYLPLRPVVCVLRCRRRRCLLLLHDPKSCSRRASRRRAWRRRCSRCARSACTSWSSVFAYVRLLLALIVCACWHDAFVEFRLAFRVPVSSSVSSWLARAVCNRQPLGDRRVPVYHARAASARGALCAVFGGRGCVTFLLA